MRNKTLSSSEKWIIIGIPIIFLIGSFMHFLYNLSGQNQIIALVAPINESIWEHLKMVILPVICWWFFYYILKSKENNIDPNKWFTSALIALLTAIITIPMLYYFYTEAFGVEILLVDIFILFASILFGQLLALFYYRNGQHQINAYISIGIFILIIVVFMVFTLYPPNLPIFQTA